MDATMGAAAHAALPTGGIDESLARSPAAVVEAGYGANLSEGGGAAAFAESMGRARAADAAGGSSAVGRALFEPLDRVDARARSLADYAEEARASGNELTPSEIVSLTVRSQEFMFEAQLTANVANRSADGLQQLFRQQS